MCAPVSVVVPVPDLTSKRCFVFFDDVGPCAPGEIHTNCNNATVAFVGIVVSSFTAQVLLYAVDDECMST